MRKLLLTICAVAVCLAAPANVNQAKALYKAGDYARAAEMLRPLVKKTPRDGNANYWLGASLLAMGKADEARPYLEKAYDRGIHQAAYDMAVDYLDSYRPKESRTWFEKYERLATKNKKSTADDMPDHLSRAVTMENMLDRVERIAIIDSIVVDADQFFKAYRLSPEAGSLVEGALVHEPDAEMAYVPQNNSQLLFSLPDSTGTFRLMSADVLDDGSVDTALALPGEDLGGGGNAEYPFMLNDGATLYFANDGVESLGGYDIFLTRKDEDGNFLQPQNLGMPYNSPYDDYMLVIDEAAGLGWWATDRNRIPGKLTIYVFIPSETRTNIPADDPAIVSLARIDNIAATQPAGLVIPPMPRHTNAADIQEGLGGTDAFVLPVASLQRIYTRLADFTTDEGRRQMSYALNARAKAAKINTQLSALRREYADGRKNTAMQIEQLEHDLAAARADIREYTNAAIAAEIK